MFRKLLQRIALVFDGIEIPYMIIGGQAAPTAVAGEGAARMADALRLREVSVERLGEDLLVTGYPSERA